MSGEPKRARGALTEARQAAVDAYWAASTSQAEREAHAWMRWLGVPSSGDPPNPPGWATLENVR